MTADELARLSKLRAAWLANGAFESSVDAINYYAALRNAAPALIAMARWAIEQRIKMQAASIMSDSVSYRACIAAALAAYPKGGWDARLLQRD